MIFELGKYLVISDSYRHKISGDLCKERGYHINLYTREKVALQVINTCETCFPNLHNTISYKVGKIIKVLHAVNKVYVQYPGVYVELSFNDVKITNLRAFE